MDIVHQLTSVDHDYLQQRQQTVTASAAGSPALSSSSTPAPVALTYTPEQQVKLRLIASLHEEASPALHHALLNALADTLQETTLSAPERQADPSAMVRVKEHLYEYEKLHYSTQLEARHSDGQEHSLSLSLTFERELMYSRELTMSLAAFKDPLIVNLGHNSALFGPGQTRFDLDADGIDEQLPRLNRDVWYLARDNNNNGFIDNGSELFGALSGDGFAELGTLDSDNNGLVDQRDSQFNTLKLWRSQAPLRSLDDAGISAISTHATSTPFTFTDQSANPLAALRKTAVFITDDLQLGGVHQVDFVV
ncbi:hypothetical protein LJ739_07750 [Aestuariibacter halophilus]|uniref:VCBS repeat-containing protein n=1 Tax=Fluctibacter halophilus TaxID=226011 RepID=A0ABS8G6L0_9ALTE|nr:hypothetical protein [Aestuariibacter halophilus]MCC2616129.1 hypothetical protein [Aestuariibacter halophilus]